MSALIVTLVDGVLGFSEVTRFQVTNTTVVRVAADAGEIPSAARPTTAAVATSVRIACFSFILSPLSSSASSKSLRLGDAKKLEKIYTLENCK